MQNCRVCGSKIIPFFELGYIPLVNSFLKKQQIKGEKRYELTTAFCPKCYLVQLTKTVPPTALFRDYIYFSSTSQTIIDHSRTTASYLTKKLQLTSESLVLEIASNDGVLLQFFQELGVRILGVDPAKNVAGYANKKGIKTIPDFFNYKFAQKIKNEGVSADLIYGANVLAHVPEIVDFVKGVSLVLKKRGTAVFEFPYIKGLFENKFDTIYHEHVFYYSLIALQNLFTEANLEIYDVEIVPMQGGSLRIFACHTGDFSVSKNVNNMVNKEIRNGYNKIFSYRMINKNVSQLKKELIQLLKVLKAQNKIIAAYSAPAKGIILLNYFEIGNNYFEFIVDKAKEKQGLYTPGMHMKVEPVEKIYEKMPDYVVILCWNIADEVMSQLNEYKKSGGKFIIPVPKIKVI